jgi:hypothetical protein
LFLMSFRNLIMVLLLGSKERRCRPDLLVHVQDGWNLPSDP